MTVKRNAREVARRVLARVAQGAYATPTLAGELGRSGLGDADRALATELVYGVLRLRERLDRALAAHAPRGLGQLDSATHDALRLGAYQILFLRVPPHAAVDDAVEAVKRTRGQRLAGFANALLRRLASSGEPPLPPIDDWPAHLAVRDSMPRWIVDRVLAALGHDAGAAALAAFNAPAPTWLRTNTLRTQRDALMAELQRERPQIQLVTSAASPDALAARHGGDLFATAAYRAGAYMAQDLGAQLVVRLLGAQPGERILDACSGLGGKSTYLAALSGDGATIDAADLSSGKLAQARDHAQRLGMKSIRTIKADLTLPDAPLAPSYDRVLLDAPCSGLGVLRRHPEAKWTRTPADVKALAELQARLLATLAPLVRPGGLLVYAVCTFTEEEGPAQLVHFLSTHGDFQVEPADIDKDGAEPALAALAAADGTLRTWPHRDDADAFYAVRLRRTNS
jgi:16S rRNA (cytosine967-C5)-methyltransferase